MLTDDRCHLNQWQRTKYCSWAKSLLEWLRGLHGQVVAVSDWWSHAVSSPFVVKCFHKTKFFMLAYKRWMMLNPKSLSDWVIDVAAEGFKRQSCHDSHAPFFCCSLNIKCLLQVINAFVLPNLKMIGERVKMALEGPVMNSADRIAAENIKKIAAVSTFILPLYSDQYKLNRESKILKSLTVWTQNNIIYLYYDLNFIIALWELKFKEKQNPQQSHTSNWDNLFFSRGYHFIKFACL